MSSQYMTLLGADEVRAAGRSISEAADRIARANVGDDFIRRFEATSIELTAALDRHAERVEAALNRHAERIEAAMRAQGGPS